MKNPAGFFHIVKAETSKLIITLCPGFCWNMVNFHLKPGGLTQTSQTNRIVNNVWYHAQYWRGV